MKILRDTLVEQCNTFIAIGGRWWKSAPALAGVRDEIDLAHKHQLPLFLLGGLGGATRGYLESHRELLRSCRNGLTEDENAALALVEDPGAGSAGARSDLTAAVAGTDAAEWPAVPHSVSRRRRNSGGIHGGGALVLGGATGLDIAPHFDLIAGTSTGGILAIGLGLGMKAADMLKFYLNEGGVIFPVEKDISRLRHSFRHWFAAKFDQEVLRRKIADAYKTAPVKRSVLDDSITRLVIPAYNTEADKLIVFRTPHGSGGANDAGRNPVDVALATAAAPTYFNPIKVGHVLAVDGGVWANSPTMVALAEAISELGVAPERVEMLSVGTTFNPSLEGQPLLLDKPMIEALIKPATGPLTAKLVSFWWQPQRIQGKLGWLPNIAGFLMKTQAQTAEHVCERILGNRFLRVDEPTVATDLDDVASIDRLIGLANAVAAKHLAVVKTQFLNGLPAERWR